MEHLTKQPWGQTMVHTCPVTASDRRVLSSSAPSARSQPSRPSPSAPSWRLTCPAQSHCPAMLFSLLHHTLNPCFSAGSPPICFRRRAWGSREGASLGQPASSQGLLGAAAPRSRPCPCSTLLSAPCPPHLFHDEGQALSQAEQADDWGGVMVSGRQDGAWSSVTGQGASQAL